MSRKDEDTPRQLATRAIAGSWLIFSIAPLTFLCVSMFGDLRSRNEAGLFVPLIWRVALLASPAVLGLILITLSEKKLRTGLSEDRWPEGSLAEARDWLNRTTLRLLPIAFGLVLLTGSVLGLLLNRHGTHGLVPFSYIFIVPATTHGQIKAMLTPPVPQKALLDWSTIKPLHSDFWGRHS